MQLRLGGVVPPPSEPVVLRERHSTGIGHASRLIADPAERSNPHLPTTISPPRDGFPLLARPQDGDGAASLEEWAAAARPVIDAELRAHGCILFRGMPVTSADDFSAFLAALNYPTMDTHGVSQRPEYAENVFGASDDVPPSHSLHMHNEQAYIRPDAQPSYPRKLFFCCLSEPESGGQTPLVLNREFHAMLGDLAARFQEKGGVRYTRYLPDLRALEEQQSTGVYDFLGPAGVRTSQESAIEALRAEKPEGEAAIAARDAALREAEERAWTERRGNSWQARLEAETHEEAEAACVEEGQQFEWQPDGGLIMYTETPGFLPTDPETEGEGLVWFSQASNFEAFTPTFGDGDPITDAEVEEMHSAMWRCAVAFDWRRGDVLVLDNERCMHGRTSFTGPRGLATGFAKL